MFYTEAWALVHYLLNRPDRKVPFASDMARYLQLIESGKEDIAAFEEAFGIKTELLNGEVRRHVKRGKFDAVTFQTDALLPVFQVNVVKLTREEAGVYLNCRLQHRFENSHTTAGMTSSTSRAALSTIRRAPAGLPARRHQRLTSAKLLAISWLPIECLNPINSMSLQCR